MQPRTYPLRAFTLPADVDARMRAEAKRRGVSYSALVAEALRTMLGPREHAGPTVARAIRTPEIR